jgi:hypothetical protein
MFVTLFARAMCTETLNLCVRHRECPVSRSKRRLNVVRAREPTAEYGRLGEVANGRLWHSGPQN